MGSTSRCGQVSGPSDRRWAARAVPDWLKAEMDVPPDLLRQFGVADPARQMSKALKLPPGLDR